MTEFSADLEIAIECALGAGSILRKAFGSAAPVEYKSRDQPVTEADRAADVYLRRTLGAARPDYGWVSEESESLDGDATAVWIVDPLDGTVNFVEDRPEFAVCIGLLRNKVPAIGVVYNPISEELYAAERGSRPTRNGKQIRASTWRYPPRLVASWSEVSRFDSTELGQCDVSTVGSTALKIMRVAEGSADVYLSSGPKRVWDLCAPLVIAQAAGALVLDGFGEPISFEREDTEVRGTIAVGRGAEAEIERLVRVNHSIEPDA